MKLHLNLVESICQTIYLIVSRVKSNEDVCFLCSNFRHFSAVILDRLKTFSRDRVLRERATGENRSLDTSSAGNVMSRRFGERATVRESTRKPIVCTVEKIEMSHRCVRFRVSEQTFTLVRSLERHTRRVSLETLSFEKTNVRHLFSSACKRK